MSQLSLLLPALLLAGLTSAVVVQLGRAHHQALRVPHAPLGADAMAPLEGHWSVDADARRIRQDLVVVNGAQSPQAAGEARRSPAARWVHRDWRLIRNSRPASGSSCSPTGCS